MLIKKHTKIPLLITLTACLTVSGCRAETLPASESLVDTSNEQSSSINNAYYDSKNNLTQEITLKDFPADASPCSAKSLDMTTFKNFPDHIIEMVQQRIGTSADFAGHYYLFDLPTPKGSVFTYMLVDCISGKYVTELEDYYTFYSEDNEQNGFRIRHLPSSRLLVLKGYFGNPNIGAEPEDYQTEYYELINNKLVLIKKTPPIIPESSEASE